MSAESKSLAAGTTETTELSLVDQLLVETKLRPSDEGYDLTRNGVREVLAKLLGTEAPTQTRIDRAYIDQLISEIDRDLSEQLDEVLHHPEFQTLESSWRGLKFIVDRTDYRENIKTEVLNCSKSDLYNDFEEAPEITKSGLYKLVYTAEYGQFGGHPYGQVFSTYELTHLPQDVTLMQKVAAVSAMAHAPFYAAAAPRFFGDDDFLALPNLKDLASLFEGKQYAKWNAFRDTPDSRYLGLVLPKFLLRLPYGPATAPAKTFNYDEKVTGSHRAYLWGNATFALADRVAESFAKYRWCSNIIGAQSGGTVANLPLHVYSAMGADEIKIPTEVLVSDRREIELAEQGFIPLTYRKDSDNAAFFSVNSAQKPKTFGNTPEDKEAELNYRLGTQFPYLFIACRFAHYLKVMQREQLGSFKERGDLERQLNEWIRQYVVDMDAPTAEVRAKRPLRKASISVSDVPGEAGFYLTDMKLRPHFKYMKAQFTLSLVGKIDTK